MPKWHDLLRSSFDKVVIRTFVVNEQVVKFFVSKEMNNSFPFFLQLVAQIFIEHSFHLLFVCVVKEHKLAAVLPNFFRNSVKVLSNQNE